MFHVTYMGTQSTDVHCELKTRAKPGSSGLEIEVLYFVCKSTRLQQMFALYTICCLETVKAFVES